MVLSFSMVAPMFPYLPPLAMSPEPALRKEVVRTIKVNDGSMVGVGLLGSCTVRKSTSAQRSVHFC